MDCSRKKDQVASYSGLRYTGLWHRTPCARNIVLNELLSWPRATACDHMLRSAAASVSMFYITTDRESVAEEVGVFAFILAVEHAKNQQAC